VASELFRADRRGDRYEEINFAFHYLPPSHSKHTVPQLEIPDPLIFLRATNPVFLRNNKSKRHAMDYDVT
jgi:hypothetical protein